MPDRAAGVALRLPDGRMEWLRTSYGGKARSAPKLRSQIRLRENLRIHNILGPGPGEQARHLGSAAELDKRFDGIEGRVRGRHDFGMAKGRIAGSAKRPVSAKPLVSVGRDSSALQPIKKRS